jgi:hypothetical protein
MHDHESGPQYVGLYWTYPVKWAGFTQLSQNAKEAARQSRTIGYQRALITRHQKAKRGVLIDEIVFLEPRRNPHEALPNGKKRLLEHPLARRLKQYEGGETILLWVDFGMSNGWRSHRHLRETIAKLNMRNEPLDPIEWPVDGELFVPSKHFREWDVLDEAADTWIEMAIPMALAAALDRIPEGYGRNPKIADYLNDLGVPTKTGLPWTRDTVKIAIKEFNMQIKPHPE